MALITTKRTNTAVGGALRELAIDASISGSTITYTGGYNHYLIDDEFITAAEVSGMVQVPETTIEDYSAFFVVGDLTALTPVGLVGSEIDGERLSWANWAAAMGNEPQERDGSFYISNRAVGGSPRSPIEVGDMVATGQTFISLAEFLAIPSPDAP